MDSVEVSTVVYLQPAEVYEFLLDFPRYAHYSEYLKEVRRHDGEGGPGTRYDLTFSWWKLSYTAKSEVTDVDPPNRIDWRIVEDIDAHGHWAVDAEPESAPDASTPASRVYLFVEFEPDTAENADIGLPPLVSLDWLVNRVEPKVHAEAERIVERIVADLEGERRDVTLQVHGKPDSL